MSSGPRRLLVYAFGLVCMTASTATACPILLWQHQVSGHVAVWLMNRMTMVAGISLGQVADTNWHIVGPR